MLQLRARVMAMLCCVSRKAAGAGAGNGCPDDVARSRASAELSRFVEVCKDLGKAREEEEEALRQLDEAVLGVAAVANTFSTFRVLETLPEEASHQPEIRHDDDDGARGLCAVVWVVVFCVLGLRFEMDIVDDGWYKFALNF